MKKTFVMTVACCLLLSSCGGMTGIGTGTTTGSQTTNSGTSVSNTAGVLGNIFSSVIGLDKLTQKSIIKTWNIMVLAWLSLQKTCWLRLVEKLQQTRLRKA